MTVDPGENSGYEFPGSESGSGSGIIERIVVV